MRNSMFMPSYLLQSVKIKSSYEVIDIKTTLAIKQQYLFFRNNTILNKPFHYHLCLNSLLKFISLISNNLQRKVAVRETEIILAITRSTFSFDIKEPFSIKFEPPSNNFKYYMVNQCFWIIKLQMRRNYNKQNERVLPNSVKRAHSHAHFIPTQNKTLAQLNHPSTRLRTLTYHPSHPVRVQLPDYFNVPKFVDFNIFSSYTQSLKNELLVKLRSEVELKRKLKDLDILAEGMRRAKNIKQQSRYYFTQGVLQHNSGAFADSIASFQKFLKIVLFIRDEKSVELALNAIGAEYMCLGDHQKALQYHKKQGEINERADFFMSRVNSGLCYEMAGDADSAMFEYREADKIVKNDAEESRKKFVQKLIGRVSSKKNDMFITAEQKSILGESLDESILPQIKPRTKKSKIDFAIKSAEQHMDRYLSNMKNSYVFEKE